MGKNGGKPTDTILTLEEALRRFARKKSEEGAATTDESAPAANVRHAGFSATVKYEGDATAAGDLRSADDDASASAQRDEANAGMSAGEDIVALIDGVPRTLEELEQIAAADENAQVEDGSEVGEARRTALAARHLAVGDYAFIAMGAAALAALAAFLITREPIVNNRPNLVAQTIAMPALKVSPLTSADELITNFVMIPVTGVHLASAGPTSDELEARIKDTLKSHAFPDIGVSVSKIGEAYLAGEVYSLNEARKIAQIVHRVNGVNRVHFLHPDVLPADGPAYFGVTTARAPEVWGAKVRAVFIGSPADKAGIKPGDVISEFDDKTIPDAKTFDGLLAQYSPGQRVELRVWHDGQPEYLVARLREATTMASR